MHKRFLLGRAGFLTTTTCARHGDVLCSIISSFMRRVISSWINVLSEKLKRRDFVAIGLEPGIRFANKYSSSITAVANAHEEELKTIRSDCDP